MTVKYIDVAALTNVIGNVFSNPKLLEATDKYFFSEEDFVDEFHKIVFGAIFNLHQLGVSEITLNAIEDYLASRPKKKAVYDTNKGNEYLLKCADSSSISTFDYYYNRMKKMTLLRMYQQVAGMDLSWLYDPDNLFDVKKKQEQEEWLDNSSLLEIADVIDDKILEIKSQCIDNSLTCGVQAGEGIEELLESLKETPEIGYPLYGKYMNTVTRGARLKKFYLRSAATGVGKSRAIAADVCNIGCFQMYDLESHKWVSIGASEPVMYIATEQDLSEVQTMMIAFVSGVDEQHILDGEYFAGEWERVQKAAQIIKQSPIYFESLPDFSLKDIENTIIRGIREHGTKYIFLDYIHTSMRILEEITQRSGGVRLREDNILFMMSIRLKDLCNQYGVFIMSATQLNADYTESETPDQNLLRGAKSIADKIDLGMIMLETTKKDREALEPMVKKMGIKMPNIKISVYKNRRGRWKGIYLWVNAQRGICRFNPVFVTKWTYELVDMEDLKIRIQDQSAF